MTTEHERSNAFAPDSAFDGEVIAAADEALSRVMRGVQEQVERMPPDLEPADALRWAGDRVTELLAGFAELPLDSLLGVATPSAAAPAEAATPTGEPLTVRAAAGALIEVRVWVHPVGDELTGLLHFRLGELSGPDGLTWTDDEAGFTPAACVLPVSRPWSTVLRCRVPVEAARGQHHGLVVARGAADAVVPITVVIT